MVEQKKRLPSWRERRPAGAFVWLTLLLVPAVLEVGAIAYRHFPWTLSHSVWWAEGAPNTWRFWLLAPAIFAFLQWVAFHFLLVPLGVDVGGKALVAMLVLALLAGYVVGLGATS